MSDNPEVKPDQPNWRETAIKLAADELPQGWSRASSSSNATVAYCAERSVYCKIFLRRSPLENLKARLRGSRATRARTQNDLLRNADFIAPENLAWGELDSRVEFLINTTVPGEGVTTWVREKLRDRDPQHLKLRRQLFSELGTHIGRLHAAGFVHGDLRTSNVLAEYHGNRFHFGLIDNERTTHQLPAPGSGMLRNLMQLNMLLPSDVTKTDRLRFFLAWRAQMPELSWVEAKVMAIESYRWAMKRLAAKGLVAPDAH